MTTITQNDTNMTHKLHKHKNDTELREILHEIYAKKTHKLHKHNAKFTRNLQEKHAKKTQKVRKHQKGHRHDWKITQNI